ncbi:LL-diaminopimelate aminotransferase [Desulfosporosinus metallidurans]|uniref:LL-diaminopimelate aminotransferase n=1 Tax=Desulfosporosinus metallidurans TaxID=1888891 RepID=A0A1Q8R178_9FIRM|nr:LL-diaminopimelate aminotransferase [Desulfosporosinus metallidurans]OLN33372.1 Aspartate aminotransferase [Desulfosporosinus metallidurans]
MEEAQRIQALPPYLFARIDEKIADAKAKGVDVISLGIGDPDLPTPDHIIDKLIKAAHNPENHRYPSYVGMLEFRSAVAEWYKRRSNIELDPKTEVVTLIGSKEGIAHIAFCYINPGDIALIPDPGYPVYAVGTLLAGGVPYTMPLKEENGFLPDLDAIPAEVAQKAKLMFLNYPNNPTGAIADESFYLKVIAFAKKYDIIVCHDGPYSEIAFQGYKPLSFLEVPGAKEVGIEFHSMSKTYNMTGWRIGWAAGNARVIEALGRIKSNIDSGVFQAIQEASIEGLLGNQDIIEEIRKIYQERQDIVIEGLTALGWKVERPKATIYVWPKVPKGFSSASFCELVLDKTGVVLTPGNGYGEYGEGYFRISLTISTERLREALRRLQDNLGKFEF